jgi:FtsZ-binding cell division protein ZapB
MKDAYESANDSLEVHETKEEVLKSVILELKKDLISNSEAKDSVKTREEFKNISNKNSVLKKKIRTTNKELKSIKAEFEATSSQLEKFQNENKELHSIRLKAIKIIENKKIEIEKLKKHHSFLTKSHKELKNNVVELKANENKLSSQVSGYQEKIEAKEAEELELNLQNEEEELQRLVGDSYEVQNEAIWYYGDKSNEQGPFTFEQMLEYKSNKTINDKTKIRQEGKAFAHPMAEVFELCINVTVFKTNAGHNRYFIKRDSYRAPFYEIITLEIDGKEFKGYCTSLSTGGAFVEFTKLDKDLMISDATARISFKHGTLSEGFSNIVSIKNISNQKPRGLGLMFEDLDAKKKKIILEYVNGFLDKSKSVDDLVNNYLKDNKKVS